MVSQLHSDMLSSIPKLRAFALSLCRNQDQAEDLIQETLLRACGNIDRFEPGTSMIAWLTVILRNQFYSEFRKRRHDIQDVEGRYVETMVVQPEQVTHSELGELQIALAQLPECMRESLILVGFYGLSYSEAARICRCATGTIKSRMHRARLRLAELLSIEGPADFGGDPSVQSVMAHAEYSRLQNWSSAQ
jgi:RNA polymerase sigma-70 factor, ECF subfamily